MLGEVAEEARGAGLEVRTARIPGSCWAGLREAAALTVGDVAPRGRRAGRRGGGETAAGQGGWSHACGIYGTHRAP
eukprot:971858-Pleurochrysis_carterae.AAC.1